MLEAKSKHQAFRLQPALFLHMNTYLLKDLLPQGCALSHLHSSHPCQAPSIAQRQIMEPSASNPRSLTEQFRKHWQSSTDDNNLTLHGFRRYKTTHLLNLRFLEGEIAELDHTIYQAGLNLGLSLSSKDRLGLEYSRRDSKVPNIDETITREFVLHLRDLIRQYGAYQYPRYLPRLINYRI